MSDRQYRTLREGDRRLPGWQVQVADLPGWVDGNPARDGDVILHSDLASHEYRVPCSATVAPDGYEVVQRERLPKGARVGATWLRWQEQPYGGRWWSVVAGWRVVDAPQVTLAAPADELTALYAQGDAEREQPAPVGDGWRLLGDDELIAHGDETSGGGAPWKEIAAFEYHRAAGVFGAHNRYRRRVEPQPVEQPAPAPATPCPCCAERDRLADEVERLLGCVDASRRRADRAEASLAAVTKAYDAALAEVERLRAQIAAARAALEGRDG